MFLPSVYSSTCQALKRKEHFSLIASERRCTNESTKARPQSVGSVLLLQHKSQVLLHKEFEGGKKQRTWREGRHPPRLCTQSFSGKSREPSVFYCECLSDFQRAPKGLQSLDLRCTCSLHTPREASETGGRAPERMLLVTFFELI